MTTTPGPRVVLTGAAGGIGRALAQAFARTCAAQGGRLLLVDREAAPLQALVAELDSPQVHSAVCDLGSDEAVAALAASLAQGWGGVDVLINNAGTESPTPLDDAAPQANARWAALLDNNVTSMPRLTRALLPLMANGLSCDFSE